MDFEIAKGKTARPWRMMLYGVPGVGKSTLAAKAPNPFFLDLERGLDQIDVVKNKNPIANLNEYKNWCEMLMAQEKVKTVVTDTLDHLEKLVFDWVCSVNNQKSIESWGYGKGYVLAREEWNGILQLWDRLVDSGKNVLVVAHEEVKKFEDPTSEQYDRYQIKVHHKSANMLIGHFDAVYFAHWEKMMAEDTRNKERKRAVGTGQRALGCVEQPSYVAKNRFGLEAIEPMDETIFQKMS